MWNVHEASKPSAISARAGLSYTWWYQIRKAHGQDYPWLDDYLYSCCALPSDAEAGGFQPTPEMLAFRKQSTTRAFLAASIRSRKRMQSAWRRDYLRQIPESLLNHWRRLYKAFNWFDRWLLRGEDPPAGVTVVSVLQARRCSHAWDYSTFCQRAGIQVDTYALWLSRRLIPDLGWLKWLFGAPPPLGAFVVGLGLQGLRHEMSRKGILKAAGLNSATIWLRERDERTSRLMKGILAGGSAVDTEEWAQLPPVILRQMLAISKAAHLDACRKRVKIARSGCSAVKLSRSGYFDALKEAERCGVKDKLLEYLKVQGQFTSRQSGLVADNFFIPTPDMFWFREKASQEGVRQKVWSIASLPGFDIWFVDRTMPKSYRGKRHFVRASSTPASSVKRNGSPGVTPAEPAVLTPPQPVGSEATRRRRGRPTASEDTRVQARRQRIVDARDRIKRSGDTPSVSRIARECGVDRTTVRAALREADS
jgi:hypothetical protein